jgi:enamine deaminase RidA (YjgF/YER057c/UK114 family)
MSGNTVVEEKIHIDLNGISNGERDEMIKLGILNKDERIQSFTPPQHLVGRPIVPKKPVHIPHILNEAYDYTRPSSFSRALSLKFGDYKILLISGTASVDENGQSIHIGDFRAQCWRTFRNITELLHVEDMTWHDIVRTSCYLRDISRDYKDFNETRTAFYNWLGLDPLPASTGIQAKICREELLVEIEGIAVVQETK